MSRRRRTRALLIGAGALAVVGVIGAASLGLGGRSTDEPVPRRTGPASTVTIIRQDLVREVTLSGELGYGRSVPLVSPAPGTVTWLPEVGSVVRRGKPLLRADEQPVVLLYGFLPMYRALAESAKGSDVRQFERNLAALGYTGFTVDETFSAGTTAAVKRWQRDLGLDPTGRVDRERVIYAPGAIRVTERRVRVGAPATGEVLAYSGTAQMVTIEAEPGKIAWAKKGTKVTVVLPGGKAVPGEVASVATDVDSGGESGAPGGEQNSGTGGATVAVTVILNSQQKLDGLSAAPVDVRYVEQRRPGVLTVPVNALLALAEGGYGLEVVDGGSTRVVAVETGLFAGGRVEVIGSELAEGMTVGVPG